MVFGGGGEGLLLCQQSVHHCFGFCGFKLVAQLKFFFGPFMNIIKQPWRIAVLFNVMHELFICILQVRIHLDVLELHCLVVVNVSWYCTLAIG
jgi:hypothetical protein